MRKTKLRVKGFDARGAVLTSRAKAETMSKEQLIDICLEQERDCTILIRALEHYAPGIVGIETIS